MRGRDIQGVWDGYVHTAILKVDSQQGPTVQHMEFCSILLGSLDGREVWGQGRLDRCICMTESLHYSPETITVFLIGYTLIQKKMFFKNQQSPIFLRGKELSFAFSSTFATVTYFRN